MGREWSGGSPCWPGMVRRPSWRVRGGWEALSKDREYSGGPIHEGREWSGGPPCGLRLVGRSSRSAGSGQEVYL